MNFFYGFSLFDDIDEGKQWFIRMVTDIESSENEPYEKREKKAEDTLTNITTLVKFDSPDISYTDDEIKLGIINNARIIYLVKKYYAPAILDILVYSGIKIEAVNVQTAPFVLMANGFTNKFFSNNLNGTEDEDKLFSALFQITKNMSKIHNLIMIMNIDVESIMKHVPPIESDLLIKSLYDHVTCVGFNKNVLSIKLYPNALFELNDLVSLLFKLL